MPNTFSLEDLNRAIETKYAPFYFTAGSDQYVLRQVLRLSKSERDMVVAEMKTLEGFQDADADEDGILSAIENVLSLVTDNNKGPDLVRLLDHDLIRVQMLLEMWGRISR